MILLQYTLMQLAAYAKLQLKQSVIVENSSVQFFCLKKNAKRMKTSAMIGANYQPVFETARRNQAWSPLKNNNNKKAILTNEDLTSTIGSDSFLTFKNQPPKRKKMPNLLHVDPEKRKTYQSISPQKHAFMKRSMSASRQLISLRPKRVGKQNFKLISKLGEGSYSEVYMAIQRKTGWICSIKILNKVKMRALKMEENVFRQIKIMLFLNHPNVTSLYGCFSDQTHIYLVSELATDSDMHGLLTCNKMNEIKGFSLQGMKYFVKQLCEALKYLHSQDIIHRDLKPQNLLISFGNTIKLCDFGWSIHNPRKQLRSTLCGTPLYLAPELISQVQYDQSVDIWALGILAFQLATNQIPFQIRSIKDLKKVVHQQIDYSKIKDQIIIDFIKRALQKDKNQRSDIFQLCKHPLLNLNTQL